jgi:beta-lactamase class A
VSSPTDEIRRAFADAAVQGWLHARPLTGGEEVAVDADQPVVMASLYKLPVLIAFCRAVDAGAIDPREPVRLEPRRRTPGPTGIGALADPVTMSWRDLARMMIAVSDNAAGDALLAGVGQERVDATLGNLGLAGTSLSGGTAAMHRALRAQVGGRSVGQALAALADNDVPVSAAVWDSHLTGATTARDMTRLLQLIWTDQAASARQCKFARAALSAQIFSQRLRTGFPYSRVLIAGKTGTLGPLRHEVGVVTFPDEIPVAVAVLTRAARADALLPQADAVIGTAAAIAVQSLRSRGEL